MPELKPEAAEAKHLQKKLREIHTAKPHQGEFYAHEEARKAAGNINVLESGGGKYGKLLRSVNKRYGNFAHHFDLYLQHLGSGDGKKANKSLDKAKKEFNKLMKDHTKLSEMLVDYSTNPHSKSKKYYGILKKQERIPEELVQDSSVLIGLGTSAAGAGAGITFTTSALGAATASMISGGATIATTIGLVTAAKAAKHRMKSIASYNPYKVQNVMEEHKRIGTEISDMILSSKTAKETLKPDSDATKSYKKMLSHVRKLNPFVKTS